MAPPLNSSLQGWKYIYKCMPNTWEQLFIAGLGVVVDDGCRGKENSEGSSSHTHTHTQKEPHMEQHSCMLYWGVWWIQNFLPELPKVLLLERCVL